jgi:hypothetical protein
VPTLDLTQSEENEVAADTHNVSSRRSTLPYGDHEEHETTEFSVSPGSGVGRHTSNGSASSELPSLADMFKPKPGEWDCQTCKTCNKPTATIRCMVCWEKPGAPAQAAVGGRAGGTTFSFGTQAAAAASSSVAPAGGSGLSAQDESRLDRILETFDAIVATQDALRAESEEKLRSLKQCMRFG